MEGYNFVLISFLELIFSLRTAGLKTVDLDFVRFMNKIRLGSGHHLAIIILTNYS